MANPLREALRQEARRQILECYLATPPTTEGEVDLLLAALTRPRVGTRHNCTQPNHCAQIRPVYDVLLDRVSNYLVWACRGGSKTYIFGGLDTFLKSVWYPGYSTSILGGSEAQSRLSAFAMDDFATVSGQRNQLLAKAIGKERAEFANESFASILTASSKSARGPHTVALKLDEVDEIDTEVYNAALSIPQESSAHGYPGVTGMFSTNHNVGGQMDTALSKAAESGVPTYRYCIWEVLESCESAGLSCSTCPLSPYCPGLQMKAADGYYRFKDFINKFHNLSVDMLQRDWFCVKTGRGDLVYQNEFDADIHTGGFGLRDAPVTVSIDWGGADPFSIGVWQDLNDKRFPTDASARVAEIYMTSRDGTLHNGKVLEVARKRPWWKLIRHVVYDSARPDLAQEWREALPRSVRFHACDKKEIDEGIEVVKACLAPVTGAPKIYFSRICVNYLREVQLYRQKRVGDSEMDWKILDQDNHTQDETRYYCQWRYKRARAIAFGIAAHSTDPR